jgi:hypothetical protein
MADSPPEPTELIAIYRLPAGIEFASECLGQSDPIEIAGYQGEVILPAVEWSGDHPYFVAPLLDGVPSAAWQQLVNGAAKDDPWLWAHIMNGKSYNIQSKEVQAAKVGAVVFRLRAPMAGKQYLQQIYADSGLLIDQGIKRLFDEVGAWFDRLAILKAMLGIA